MKISFNINFHTVWGQVLYITGSIPELGSWNNLQARQMRHAGDGNWTLEIELPDENILFEYRYFLLSNEKRIFEEWQRNHRIEIHDVRQSYTLVDYWQNWTQNRTEYSSAFLKSWFAHPCDKFERSVKSDRKVIFKVLAPKIRKNESLAMLGNQEGMGNWSPDKAILLSCDHFPEWRIELDSSQFTFPVEYKFCVIRDEDKQFLRWEDGENRTLYVPSIKERETLVVSGLQFRDSIPDWKCAGTVIPVFSLRSETSFGIGDFSDLKQMIDWLSQTGQRILQILPINDTTATGTWMDSYPYNAISIYALHPIYLSLSQLGKLKKKENRIFFEEKQKELNALDKVDYEKVYQTKWMFFQELFDQEEKVVLQSEEFLLFFENNKDWLIPYAAFSYLRDKNGTSNFKNWTDFYPYNKKKIEKLCHSDNDWYSKIAIYYYLQYHLHKQLIEVKSYAYLKGIVLKGDIPIGISKTSVEAWCEPELFNMNFQTGAPPDDFSVTGQNWGFPTYNWEAMENNHFEWWKRRFRKMSDYFDAYRIDHILGFFRIWEIPDHSVQGLLGYFVPALPFSVEEIENAGMRFDFERFTKPYIHENILKELFEDQAGEVSQIYFERITSSSFALKEKFNTQQKIKKHFEGKTDDKSIAVRENLYALCNDVLFIEDRTRPDHYHPRISAGSSYVYKDLNNADRYAFDFLYWNYFYQRHTYFWKEQGLKKLTPLISATNMLVCGEDLGMIPQSVPEVMKKLQILSLEIERMPKESNIEFTNLHKLPYLSVCMTSTHDMSTLRGWWKENREKTQRYYNHVLGGEGNAPEECTPYLCEQIIRTHLQSPSMLTIIPLQDWLSMDQTLRREKESEDRINIPANPRHNWNYRMHISLEELLSHPEFKNKIISLVEESGR
jgi:4-alpha-glucanotransferase